MSWMRKSDRRGGDGHEVLADGTSVDLVLYKYDSCFYCRRVFQAIERLGVQVEYRDVRDDPAWRADLRERTGRSQVPCLLVDGEPMFESRDIVAWLEERFGRRVDS